jgi:hypothetical protein
MVETGRSGAGTLTVCGTKSASSSSPANHPARAPYKPVASKTAATAATINHRVLGITLDVTTSLADRRESVVIWLVR